jgi:hypothetical protein
LIKHQDILSRNSRKWSTNFNGVGLQAGICYDGENEILKYKLTKYSEVASEISFSYLQLSLADTVGMSAGDSFGLKFYEILPKAIKPYWCLWMIRSERVIPNIKHMFKCQLAGKTP